MFIGEMQGARSGMKVAAGIVVLAAAVGAVKLWASGATGSWASTGVMVGAGLIVIVAAWIVGVWIRNRQRRRLMETRDSALW
jgi:hypothetical protein